MKEGSKILRSDLNWLGHRSLCDCAQEHCKPSSKLNKFVVNFNFASVLNAGKEEPEGTGAGPL